MPGVFVVCTDAVEGREEEFNDWYSNVHLPEILELSTFISARRFRVEPDLDSEFEQRYLAIYEVTDCREAFDELDKARPELTLSDTLSQETVLKSFFTQIGN